MPEAARREMLEKTAAALLVRRVGLGEDIARQILALMTNGFATGSIVYLDGGGSLVCGEERIGGTPSVVRRVPANADFVQEARCPVSV